MKKRDLFTELVEGFEALREEREGKKTLRTTVVNNAPAPFMSGQDIIALRESLNFSQGLFAAKICTNPSTLRKWEQGQSAPNDQARTLLGLIKRNPKILDEIEQLKTG